MLISIAPMNEAIKRVDEAYNPPAFNVLQAGQWLATSFGHMEDVWSVRLIFNLVHLGIQLAFIIIAVEMTIARIEFYLIVLFALVLVPFIASGPLRFYRLARVFRSYRPSPQVGIIVAIVTLGMHVMSSLNSSILNQMNPTDIDGSIDFSVVGLVLASCAVLVFLSIQVPALAMALISGNPALSASGFPGNMMGIAAIGMAAANGLRSVIQSGGSSHSYSHPPLPTQHSQQPAPQSSARRRQAAAHRLLRRPFFIQHQGVHRQLRVRVLAPSPQKSTLLPPRQVQQRPTRRRRTECFSPYHHRAPARRLKRAT